MLKLGLMYFVHLSFKCSAPQLKARPAAFAPALDAGLVEWFPVCGEDLLGGVDGAAAGGAEGGGGGAPAPLHTGRASLQQNNEMVH